MCAARVLKPNSIGLEKGWFCFSCFCGCACVWHGQATLRLPEGGARSPRSAGSPDRDQRLGVSQSRSTLESKLCFSKRSNIKPAALRTAQQQLLISPSAAGSSEASVQQVGTSAAHALEDSRHCALRLWLQCVQPGCWSQTLLDWKKVGFVFHVAVVCACVWHGPGLYDFAFCKSRAGSSEARPLFRPSGVSFKRRVGLVSFIRLSCRRRLFMSHMARISCDATSCKSRRALRSKVSWQNWQSWQDTACASAAWSCCGPSAVQLEQSRGVTSPVGFSPRTWHRESCR